MTENKNQIFGLSQIHKSEYFSGGDEHDPPFGIDQKSIEFKKITHAPLFVNLQIDSHAKIKESGHGVNGCSSSPFIVIV